MASVSDEVYLALHASIAVAIAIAPSIAPFKSTIAGGRMGGAQQS